MVSLPAGRLTTGWGHRKYILSKAWIKGPPAEVIASCVLLATNTKRNKAISPPRPVAPHAFCYSRAHGFSSAGLADGPTNQASPRGAARCMAGSDQAPNQMGGLGRCTGRGAIVALSTR